MELLKHSSEVVQMACKIEDISAQANAAISGAKVLIERNEKVKELCKKIDTFCSTNGTERAAFRTFGRALDNAVYGAKEAAFDLYKTEFSSLTWRQQRTITDAIISDYQAENKKIEGIDSFVSDDAFLCIRLPILAAKQGRWKRINGAQCTVPEFHFFVDELNASLMLIDHEIPPFCEKNITYIFVYGDGRKFLADSDNYNTKAITDVVVAHTSGGDTAKNCTFFYASICNNQLPEGTYITVSPEFGVVPDLYHILSVWERHK